MTKVLRWSPLIMSVIGAIAFFALQAHAETNRVQLPPSFDGFVHYTTVRRGNVTEHIMTTPEAIEAVRSGRPIPSGTQFLLVDYREGKLYRTFVMQKGEGWGADYDDSRRTGDWQFQWFWADGSVNMNENTARCQSCHSGQSRSEYLFTGNRIPRFNGTPIE